MEKINPKHLDEADQVLAEIATLIGKYERLFRMMTPHERALIGGIAFHIFSIWNDKKLVGIVSDKTLASSLVVGLMEFLNRGGGGVLPIPSKEPDESLD